MRILLTGPGYTDAIVGALSARGHDVLQYAEITRGALLALLPSLDAYVLGGDERLDAVAIDAADRLKVISFVGTGYGDFIDVGAAARRGIRIASTPSIAGPAVAEHTLGLLLGAIRGLFAHNESAKRGASQPGPTVELRDTKVGLVGLGDIGSRFARMLRLAFDARVAYHSRTRKPELERELGLDPCDLPTLFRTADAVVLLAPISPGTIHLVGRDLLQGAKPGLTLVNTAGARLVDPEALRQALDDGVVARAAFDSYWIEPLPSVAQDPFGLLGLPDARFVVTPHVAAKTTGSWRRMLERAVANVAAQGSADHA